MPDSERLIIATRGFENGIRRISTLARTCANPGAVEAEANARLIAAAPELYEALILAEDVLSRFPFSSEIWPNGTHPNRGIEQIRAALALATGASQ